MRRPLSSSAAALGAGYGGFSYHRGGPRGRHPRPRRPRHFAVGLSLGRGTAVHIDACAMALVSPPSPSTAPTARAPRPPTPPPPCRSSAAASPGATRRTSGAASLGGVAVMGGRSPAASAPTRTTMRRFDCSYASRSSAAGPSSWSARLASLCAWRIGARSTASSPPSPTSPRGGVQPSGFLLRRRCLASSSPRSERRPYRAPGGAWADAPSPRHRVAPPTAPFTWSPPSSLAGRAMSVVMVPVHPPPGPRGTTVPRAAQHRRPPFVIAAFNLHAPHVRTR